MTLDPRPERRTSERGRLLRVGLPLSLAATLVAAALVLPSSGAGGPELSLRQQNELAKAERGLPHVDSPGMPAHTHDPAFKNAVARGGEALSGAAADPTTAAEAAASAAFVESERALPDPTLGSLPLKRTRALYPTNRYEMAGGCYTLRTARGAYIQQVGCVHPGAQHPARARRCGCTFKATRLGAYLLYSADGRFLAGKNGEATTNPEPSNRADWTVKRTKGTKIGAKRGDRIRQATPSTCETGEA